MRNVNDGRGIRDLVSYMIGVDNNVLNNLDRRTENLLTMLQVKSLGVIRDHPKSYREEMMPEMVSTFQKIKELQKAPTKPAEAPATAQSFLRDTAEVDDAPTPREPEPTGFWAGFSRRRDSKRKAREMLDSAVALHAQIMARYSEYEMDVAKQIDFPEMVDVRISTTAEYIKAMRLSRDTLDSLDPRRCDIDEARRAMDQVRSFQASFDLAEKRATEVRWDGYPVDTTKKLDGARSLLNRLMDGSIKDEATVQGAIRSIIKSMKGIVKVEPSAFGKVASHNALMGSVLAQIEA